MVGVYYYVQGQANSSRDAALNIARGECLHVVGIAVLTPSNLFSVSGRAIERILDNQKAPIYEMSGE